LYYSAFSFSFVWGGQKCLGELLMFARHRRLPARIVSVTFALAFVIAALYGKCLERERFRPHGRFNEPQIIERANLIGSALIDRFGTLQVHPHRTDRRYQDGKLHPFWFLDYTSEEGVSVLRLGFDGVTGDLYFATVCPVQNFPHLSRLAKPGALDSEAALRTSRDWVYALGLAPQAEMWKATHRPRAVGRVWHITWSSEKQTFHFSLDRQTGRLVMAQIQV
jgi:hypothetical protein